MIHFEDDIEDDYDVLDHGIFSEAEEDNDVEKPSKKSGDEGDGEENDRKKKKATKAGAPRRVSQNPKPKLNADRLCGPRGIIAVQEAFKNVKLKGKGYEKADLDLILSKMEHWAHRLFPQLPFDDCVEQVAKVGSNRSVQVYLKRFRADLLDNPTAEDDEPVDLHELPHSPPQQQSGEQLFNQLMSNMCNTSASSVLISQEQQQRMAENKRRAEEKRKSRLQNASLPLDTSDWNASLLPSEPSVENPLVPNDSSPQKLVKDADLVGDDGVETGEHKNNLDPEEPSKDGDEDLVGIDDMLDDMQ